MKVLLSPHGIGIGTLAQALRRHGVDAESCSFSRDIYAYLSDICLDVSKYTYVERERIKKQFFKKAVRKYDLFHFHFGETFSADKSDLKELKNMGKKLVVHHNGSDARMLSVARSCNNPYAVVKDTWPEEKVRANLQRLSSYIDHAIINDEELTPHVQPYYKHVHVIPYTIDVKQIQPVYARPVSDPLIVHAPSHREIKGTEFVLAAVERLRKEGHRFRFQLVENLPHSKVLQLYKEASIVIDQLRIGTYANLSMEMMALGKPVICYIRADLLKKFPSKLPLVNANPDTIYDVLKNVLRRPEEWEEIGIAGRKYVEDVHSYEAVAPRLIEVYKQL